MKLVISGVKFSFNSSTYSQENGIAMGSPLGPTLANIFMGYIELKVIPAVKISYCTSGMLMIVLCWSEVRKLWITFSIFLIMLITLSVSQWKKKIIMNLLI